MKELLDRILAEGRVIDEEILKVDTFLNHGVDVGLLERVGEEFAGRFAGAGATKVATVEASGIAPALFTSRALDIPLMFAKKSLPAMVSEGVYSSQIRSFTRNKVFDVTIGRHLIAPGDRLLIIDDFLAHGSTVNGLIGIAAQAGASVVGIGIVIAKAFQGAEEALSGTGIELFPLVTVDRMSGGLYRFWSQDGSTAEGSIGADGHLGPATRSHAPAPAAQALEA
jgi:xanthine phosphoribosyltransferase